MSLQELCLNEIINEFDYYYMIYHMSDDAKIKRLFEFLQRKYSFKIVSRLHANDELKEEYIDLLVNTHLKFIDTQWFKNCSWETISSKFEEIGSKLVKVHFHDFIHEEYTETPWQDIMCHLPNLEVMIFQEDCTDKILESVAKHCPSILEIDLRNSCISNEGIKTLCLKEQGKITCSKLKRLFVGSTEVSEVGMKHLLQNLPSLEFTDYFDLPQLLYKLHKDDLSALDKIEPYKLINLDILNYGLVPFFDDLLNICLTLCPNLKALSCSLFDEKHINVFSTKLPHLEKLHLENYSNSVIDINNLLKSKGGQLTSLTVQNYIVSVSVLAKHCTRLKQLNLIKVHFIVDGEDSKLLFPCLDSCAFEENATSDSTTEKAVKLLLSYSPKLESIAFRRFPSLSSEMKTQILKCCENCSIKSINFSYSTVEMSLLRDIIMNCLSLKSLNLEGCDLDDEQEQELYSLAEGRPNNPRIFFNEELSVSDYDDFLNDYYDFEDELDDDDYDDDFYLNHYDYDDEDDDDDYGYYYNM